MNAMKEAWRGFTGHRWQNRIDVRDFIQKNYRPYHGDGNFLAETSPNTRHLWDHVLGLMKEENKTGVLGVDTKIVSGINSHGPGYIDKNREKIV